MRRKQELKLIARAKVLQLQARDQAFVSGDRQAVLSYLVEWGVKVPPGVVKNEAVFELWFHKQRTAIKSLPLDVRRASKLWLEQHGFKSLDSDL